MLKESGVLELDGVTELLKKYNQKNLIEFFNILNEKEKTILENQIKNIDFEQMMELYNNTKKQVTFEEKSIEHIEYKDKSKVTNEEKEELDSIGKEIIKNGKYAVVTMAGGQGTRLGHSGPKGTLEIKVNSGKKYLFQIIVESLQRANEKYNSNIPWYIMTSRENNKDTLNFLEEHNYFGYDKNNVKLFIQGELPLVDVEGNLVIGKDKKIKEAADGNGGIYEAMSKGHILEDMQEKEIEWIFVGGIDNILLNIVDPTLLGLTVKEKNLIASKSIVKREPKEKAGVFCKINGKPKVIEYTELPDELAEQVNENGELVFAELNILSLLYNINVLKDLANIKLKYHTAFKKSDYLDKDGKYIEVNEPNVYKFEAFIFDAFERYENMSILRVKREDEFAPIKNKTGEDSPETAIKLYNEKFKIGSEV